MDGLIREISLDSLMVPAGEKIRTDELTEEIFMQEYLDLQELRRFLEGEQQPTSIILVRGMKQIGANLPVETYDKIRNILHSNCESEIYSLRKVIAEVLRGQKLEDRAQKTDGKQPPRSPLTGGGEKRSEVGPDDKSHSLLTISEYASGGKPLTAAKEKKRQGGQKRAPEEGGMCIEEGCNEPVCIYEKTQKQRCLEHHWEHVKEYARKKIADKKKREGVTTGAEASGHPRKGGVSLNAQQAQGKKRRTHPDICVDCNQRPRKVSSGGKKYTRCAECATKKQKEYDERYRNKKKTAGSKKVNNRENGMPTNGFRPPGGTLKRPHQRPYTVTAPPGREEAQRLIEEARKKEGKCRGFFDEFEETGICN